MSQPSQTLRGGVKIKEAGDYVGLKPITLRRLIKRGLIRPNRATRHLVFPIAELDRFLLDNRVRG
jgi:DNA-binding transcriptional MerR regulator